MTDSKRAFLARVGTLPKFGSGIGLHRTALLMKELKQELMPDDYFAGIGKIVITGSDGKGSTATIVDNILQSGGLKTALFTSPHFLDFNERFKINGTPVDYDQLLPTIERIIDAAKIIERDLDESFGVFEILFVLALTTFAAQRPDVMVFEAGIGGRYDPVRLLKSDLTALTSVALEHTALLGNSEELIACDKLDACAPGGSTVVGHISPALRAKLHSYASLSGIEIIDSGQVTSLSVDADPGAETSGSNPIKLTVAAQSIDIGSPLRGECQHYNIQTAVTLCQSYYKSDYQRRLGHDLNRFLCQVKQGIENSRLPGRFQRLAGSPELIIDAAHTPAAYTLLFDTIAQDFSDQPLIFIAGVSQGRDSRLLAEKLLWLGSEIVVTQAAFKGADAGDLYRQLQQQSEHRTAKLHLEPGLAQALKLARQQARACGGRIFVVGGLFLAGEVAAIEKGMDVDGLYLY